jgi:hypothetical protein
MFNNLNGVQTPTIPISGFYNAVTSINGTNTPVWIGSALATDGPLPVYGPFFHGLVDEVEIFGRALAASEIQAIFNAGGAGKCKATLSAQIQQPVNADGTSIFNLRRGVVPVKFTLTNGGVATCDLPPATIVVTRTSGGTPGPIDEAVYTGSADNGSNFRISNCQYVYNLSASALGVGTYRADIKINGTVVGNAIFQLK